MKLLIYTTILRFYFSAVCVISAPKSAYAVTSSYLRVYGEVRDCPPIFDKGVFYGIMNNIFGWHVKNFSVLLVRTGLVSV